MEAHLKTPHTVRARAAVQFLNTSGRSDLAAKLVQNQAGDPSFPDTPSLDPHSRAIVVRAIRHGHEVDPEGRPIVCPRDEPDRANTILWDNGAFLAKCGECWLLNGCAG